jgi:hypothetical protein
LAAEVADATRLLSLLLRSWNENPPSGGSDAPSSSPFAFVSRYFRAVTVADWNAVEFEPVHVG